MVSLHWRLGVSVPRSSHGWLLLKSLPPPRTCLQVHPLSRVHTALTLLQGGLQLAGCQTRIWVLPKALISSLKQSLGAGMPGGSTPTANDVLGALLASSMAWLEPQRVASRGGLNLHVVVNARGGG